MPAESWVRLRTAGSALATMGARCCGSPGRASPALFSRVGVGGPASPTGPAPAGPRAAWTEAHCTELQKVVDAVFGDVTGEQLKKLSFSMTIADPSLPDCPLIGCSKGFCDMCGYSMNDIVGNNCRFLIDPVPKEEVDPSIRAIAKGFVIAVQQGSVYKIPDEHRRPFMPIGAHVDGGVFCLQMNAKKSGTLFRNMFYMKVVELDDKPYIIGLQAEMQDIDPLVCLQVVNYLDNNMLQVQRLLAQSFWTTFAMDRQDEPDQDDGYVN